MADDTSAFLSTTISIALGIITLVVLYSIAWYRDRAKFKIPGPFELPFFGHYFLLRSHVTGPNADLFDFVLKNHKQYGKFFTFKVPLISRYVLVADPEALEYVLKTKFENYEKGPTLHRIFLEFLGDGIFNADRQIWKQQRQTASHLFAVKELKSYIDLFSGNTTRVIELLLERASSKDKTQVVDMQDVFQRFTLDSITKIAFGVDVNSLRQDSSFSKAFDQCNESVAIRNFNPFTLNVPWIFSTERKLRKATKIVDQFAYDIINKRRKDGVEGRVDLLSRYMSMVDDDGKPFGDVYLRDIAVNFLLAGRDTTSQLLTWTIYLLSQHPDVESKVLAEIASTLNGEEPTYENTKNMKFMKAVLDETLRLYPPVPFERKEAVHEDTLPNGLFIPQGATIVWNLYAIGRLSDFYEDPESFKPERWLNDNEQTKVKSSAFIPFLYGPRTCLGQQMAYTQVKVVLCHLLPKIKFKHVEDHKVMYDSTFITLRAKYGMHMYVFPRE